MAAHQDPMHAKSWLRGIASRVRHAVVTMDPWLAAVLIVAALFCLYGIEWGRVECWNRDQMALRGLRGLKPMGFAKPPFHTYLNHLLVLWPIQVVEAVASFFSGARLQFNEARLLGSRLLVMALLLGTIALGYVVSSRFYGKFAARVVALFLGTSAGFVVYAHFLTVDSPLLFWMLAALFFAQRIVQSGDMRDYVWAGLMTGICTATKYNGLAVGIVIPVAHLLSTNCRSLVSCLFAKRLVIGLAMVLAGFILGTPGAVFEYQRFARDFMYNYTVTPAYGGQTGYGYGEFLGRFPEILGWPGAIAISLLAVASLVVLAVRRTKQPDTLAGFLLAASVAVIYYVKIGAFARVETRYVLPMVPFCVLMAGPLLQALQSRWRLVGALLAPVICYNAVCSFHVGKRFTADPRLDAQNWMVAHVQRGNLIESSAGSPHWAKLARLGGAELNAENPNWSRVQPGTTVDLRMPEVNGRSQLFKRVFQGNRWVEERSGKEEGEPNEELFTLAELAKRNPDYIAVYSARYQEPNEKVKTYYTELLGNRFPYAIAFDGDTPPIPRFIYPASIDFLDGRMTILERRPGIAPN